MEETPSASLERLSRRQFLATSAAAAALCAGGVLLPTASSRAATVKRPGLPLDGDWEVAKAGTDDWMRATVPGCIHTDLLAAGKIADPFYRDNEKSVQWVGETDWVYRRAFQPDAVLLAQKQILLRCEGIDTLATIRINGQEIARTDNMFRTWEFEVKSALKPGVNQIEILLNSAVPFVKALDDKRAQNKGVTGRAWLRKQPCQFGWDWAPTLITSGIWRNISLVGTELARLDDVLVLQDHAQPDQVGLTIKVSAQNVANSPFGARVRVTREGRTLGETNLQLVDAAGSGSIVLRQPELWWPAGMGAQPLYEVRVDLVDGRNRVIDTAAKRIGLRTLKILEKQDDRPLQFVVNGIPFFAKGANWIPADAFSNRVSPERLRQYVADAVAVNMNMLRFWGGGYYEEDALFDACDEMGVCVWVDFKFACASYPAFDPKFVENVRQEARDNLKRLRHHPSIAVWCGNNEISLLVKDDWSIFSMGRDGYESLFKKSLGDEVRLNAPQASYVSGSPDCGDVHYWEVWWGARTFEAYRELSGFLSEFGYQSYPEPRTVHSYTGADDRASTMSDIMKWHQRCPLGNDRIKNMTGNYFRPGKDFDNTLWISQLVQAYGVKLGAEYWRQNMPRSMGCLFWQYNDCWPVASWASVDYYGRWKALHYAARHFYAPVMVSGLEDAPASSIKMFITSDLLTAESGVIEWKVTDLRGNILENGANEAAIPARHSQLVHTLDLKHLAQPSGTGHLLVWMNLKVAGREVSRNMVSFARPKDLDLFEPGIKTEITKIKSGFRVKLTAEKPALWVWLSLPENEARYSDNFVHLDSHTPFTIDVIPAKSMSHAEFEKSLVARSVYDTYAQEA
jgi:beta-mannosidase